MNSQEKSHASNRLKVCIGCMRKGKRALSSECIKLVKKHVLPSFDSEDQRFPSAICNSCYLMIKKAEKGGTVKFPDVERQVNEPETEPLQLRSAASERCTCKICSIATCNGQAAINMKRKVGVKPLNAKTPVEKAVKVCSNCFAEIYRGCNHSQTDCASKRKKVENLKTLVSSPTTERRIGDSSDASSTVPLGRPKIKEAEARKQLFSTDDISCIQKDLSLSNRQTFVLAQDLRLAAGSKKIIEPHLRDTIFEADHQLDDIFELRTLRFCKESKENQPSILTCLWLSAMMTAV